MRALATLLCGICEPSRVSHRTSSPLSDLCVDADERRHDACMDAVFPTLARVMPSDEWLAALGRPGGGGGPGGSPQKTAAGALRGLL